MNTCEAHVKSLSTRPGLILFSYLAVTPFLDIALHRQAATADKILDTFGDDFVSSVTFRQIAAHCFRDFDNYKCNFPPGCLTNGENKFINSQVARRIHCERLQSVLKLWIARKRGNSGPGLT